MAEQIHEENKELHEALPNKEDNFYIKKNNKEKNLNPKSIHNINLRESLFSFENQQNLLLSNESILKINLVIISKTQNKENSTQFITSKKQQNDLLLSFNLKINENITVNDLIKISVMTFNEKLKEANLNYLLNDSDNFKDYKMKPSRKTGYPNSNIPGNF